MIFFSHRYLAHLNMSVITPKLSKTQPKTKDFVIQHGRHEESKVKYIWTYWRTPSVSISPSMEKRELRDDYFGFIATSNISKGEILLEEEAFAGSHQPDGQVCDGLWRFFLFEHAQEMLIPMFPRRDKDALSFFKELEPTQVAIDLLKDWCRFGPGNPLSIIAKIRANMFWMTEKNEALLFSHASVMNSCSAKGRPDALWTITAHGGKRKITFKAVRDINKGAEILTHYGDQTMETFV
jgi:hypothetical protein